MALDDVGADHRSLALMPFVDPEVIKLDLRLVQDNPSPAIAAIVHAVNAESERSGAVLLAEGIETEEQLAVAPALGARYGQGWLFGRPGELPLDTVASRAPIAPRRVTPPAPRRRPYDAVAARVRPRRGTKAAPAGDLAGTSRRRSPRRATPRSSSPRSRTRATSRRGQRRSLRAPGCVGGAGRRSRRRPVGRARPGRPRRRPRRRRRAGRRVERHRHRPALRRGLRRPRPRRHRRPGHGAALRLLSDLRPRPRDRGRARVARTDRPSLESRP